MNEMKMLRDHHDSHPAPAPAAIAAARARLAARARPETARTRRRPVLPLGRRHALAAVGVAGTATAAVLAPAVLGGDHADRAYAVERLPDGRIKVTLHEFADSAGLQRRLDDLGVRAVVTYLPEGMRCAVARRAQPDPTMKVQPMVVEDPFAHAAPPSPSERNTFYILAERIRPGQTLVWTMSYRRDLGPPEAGTGRTVPFTLRTGAFLTRGPVLPCQPVPVTRAAPPLPSESDFHHLLVMDVQPGQTLRRPG
ncbi:hypothetical protein DPM19_19040 [Actinomadura craniellae]|uniref:Uncharacterized protein n=1 Tax=Actinomadura craniellae TaxID=2231787 RepID=A0A365H3T0_9ACTN|nr:hypothetical protein [Actinomadura craniellae]RAY13751.1 hypothetical protein DPM19_19040 [Actinomadura craniellae]